MKITGYCIHCRRIRTVQVTGLQARSVQTGICDSCEDKERRRDALRDVRIVSRNIATEPLTCGVCDRSIPKGIEFFVGRSSARRWPNQQAPVCREDADLIRY